MIKHAPLQLIALKKLNINYVVFLTSPSNRCEIQRVVTYGGHCSVNTTQCSCSVRCNASKYNSNIFQMGRYTTNQLLVDD